MKETKQLLKEAMEKHRKIKKDLLEITGRAAMPNITKQNIQDELFKLYMEIK